MFELFKWASLAARSNVFLWIPSNLRIIKCQNFVLQTKHYYACSIYAWVISPSIAIKCLVFRSSTTSTCFSIWCLCYSSCLEFIACPLLTDPANGTMNCILRMVDAPVEGDTCSFTCDDGYELTGNAMRTCESSGNWSGDNVTCTRSMLYNVLGLYHLHNLILLWNAFNCFVRSLISKTQYGKSILCQMVQYLLLQYLTQHVDTRARADLGNLWTSIMVYNIPV